MVCAAVASLVVIAFNLESNLTTVGKIPTGLPELTLPPMSLNIWLELLPAALIIAVVTYVESYSIGTTLATRTNDRINANQELLALGLANISAGFTGAYPVAGSFFSVQRKLCRRCPHTSQFIGLCRRGGSYFAVLCKFVCQPT